METLILIPAQVGPTFRLPIANGGRRGPPTLDEINARRQQMNLQAVQFLPVQEVPHVIPTHVGKEGLGALHRVFGGPKKLARVLDQLASFTGCKRILPF